MRRAFWIALAVVIFAAGVVSGLLGGVWEVVSSLSLLGYGVYCLLVVYRRVGRPPGVDASYDAWLAQWGPALKYVGWGWVVFSGVWLVVAVVALLMGRSVW
jgi:hypothetical protein